MVNVSWLIGLADGDGYLDDRHLEIYSSSETILKTAISVLKKLKVRKEKIKIDIYSEKPVKSMIKDWLNKLNLPLENFRLRKNTSPWHSRTEKLRLRVASKELVTLFNDTVLNEPDYIRGLFDAEGSVDVKCYIEFKQVFSDKGKELTNKVHRTLKAIGVNTTEPKIKNDRNIKKDIYFYVKDLEMYRKKVGFVDSIKKQKLDILIRARKSKRKPSLSEIQKLEKKTIWEKISILNCPYHVIRSMKNH